jgi:hypothetical protein
VKRKSLNRTAWLWWMALVIASIAGLSIYFVLQDPLIHDTQQKINSILFGAGTLIGICIISATSQWWLKR